MEGREEFLLHYVRLGLAEVHVVPLGQVAMGCITASGSISDWTGIRMGEGPQGRAELVPGKRRGPRKGVVPALGKPQRWAL